VLTGIDHIVIACPDLDEAAAALESGLGLRAGGGGRHEALGTANRLTWLGDAYLELIAIVDADVAAQSWLGQPALRALATGGGLAAFALASDDLDADLGALRAHGARLDGPFAGERLRADGRTVRWRLGLPPGLGPGEPPFLIEHDPTGAEWTPAERAVRAEERHPAGGPVRLQALELPVHNVAQAQVRVLRSTGLLFRPSLNGRGARDASIGAHTIRLRPARGTEPPTIRLRVLGRSGPAVTVERLGCRFVLESLG
jgi:catechol 2,3-dioxygenase-like lactoylglutathione lyase family enzyme